MLNNGNKAVSDDGDMNLYPDSIFGFAPKCFDAKVLLNPFEEQFHLPAVAVKQSDVLGREVEIVGVVNKRPSEVRRVIDNSSEVGRIVSSVSLASETDSLVEQNVVFSVDRLNIQLFFLLIIIL